MNHYLLFCWRLIDAIYFKCTRLQYIDGHKPNIFRVRMMNYRGLDIRLADGTTIANNDLLLKIHLHNVMLMKEMTGIDNNIKKALYLYNRTRDCLPAIAGYLYRHPEKHRVKGIIGITLLNRGVQRLGFEVHPIPNRLYRTLKQSYMLPMLLMMCPERMRFGVRQDKLQPKLLLMSKETLFHYYLYDGNSQKEGERLSPLLQAR